MSDARSADGEVRFEKVRKAFGTNVVVRELDLAIRGGEFVSLLGPSGCGKTTTLRMLAGLEFPTSGSISIGGRVVNEVAPGARDVAMVFQSYALYPHMTVAENIAYPLRKRGVPKPEREQRVQRAAESLHLTELLSRKPRQLSGGQQQRVALGRALVRDPRVFLLDEPLSNLDAKLRAHMRAELIELHARIRRTFIYVTHDQLEAMTMSDRIAVMHEGVLQQFGTPAEVYNRPANLFVAGFIGAPTMNLLHGQAAEGAFHHPALGLPFAGGSPPASGQRLVLGLRPEDVVLGTGPFAARIRLVEPHGHEQIVQLDIEGGDTLTIRADAALPLAAGEALRWGLRTARLHLFNAESGGRIDAAFTAPAEAAAA
ncbi:ABC transporter ATP-binding protein [Falsiroseomonas oryzae]|uniref:ABC transporter ATP-binding protein n=1 Tax=Falsiroseomonas oryzae TaxID=2766473 RepID=UPI0022EB5528|nr:ABC transporter ATP-binding protein [Roseomonas sp. MO-31]